MKIVLSIDDTDMPGGPGSGQLAERLSNEIEQRGWGRCAGICRHQLFVHEDVPYTSHNSSMSFPVDIDEDNLQEMMAFGEEFLGRESADGSDPGFCAVVLDEHLQQEPLIEFGQRAKREVLDKDSAYNLANLLGVHLSEHGGTGDGVIGALAGVGLRLFGSDGRMRGWYSDCSEGEEISAVELLQRTGAERAVDPAYMDVASSDIIRIGDQRIKKVLMGGKEIIPLVKAAGGGVQARWATLTKEEVKRF